MFDAMATSRALIANVVERTRRQRLTLATTHPRRAALSFLDEARWSRSGLIAYEDHPYVTRWMFKEAARSARIDRSALADLHRATFDWRHRHPDFFWHEVDHWQLLHRVADPCVFNPPAYWSLLWALLEGEQSFQTEWVDAWSHEEHLTGHFLTTAAAAGARLKPAYDALDRASGAGARCSIDYVDTATGRRERQTGADFGVVVHGADRSNAEWVKAVLFQVKKTEQFGHFEIDFDQLKALLRAPELGYYLLITRNAPSAPPPVIIAANAFENDLRSRSKERQEAGSRSDTLGSGMVGRDNYQDWAFFMALAVSDPASGIGVSAATPLEAAHLLLRRSALAPSRIIAFGLGEMAGRTNWRHLVQDLAQDQ